MVSAQNGLNELAIAEVVGAERTVGAFVNFGADYLEPGVIHYGGHGAVVVGEIDGRITPRVTAIRDAWRHFDPRAIVTPNIWGYLWGKEAYGAMLFATALTNESIADALAMPAYRPLYIALAREILAVAAARGVRPEAFDGFDPAAYLTTAPAGAAERSLDALWRTTAARPNRTAASGATSRCGSGPPKSTRSSASWSRSAAEAGVPTPLTARLVELIHEIERGARPQSLDTLDALAATPVAHGPPHEPGLQRQDRHRHRRRAWVRARHQPGVRRARRATSGRATCSRTSSARRKPSAAAPAGSCPRGDHRRARPRPPSTRASPTASAALGPRGHPGEQRRRRAWTGGTAARADHAGGVAERSSTSTSPARSTFRRRWRRA